MVNVGVDFKNSNVEESNIEEWKTIIDVNLTGAYFTTKISIPYLKKQAEVRYTNLALFMATHPLIGPTGQSFSLIRRDL